ALAAKGGAHCEAMRTRLAAGREAMESVVRFVVAQTKAQPNAVFAGSVPYLRLCGIVLSGWQMARALLVAIDRESEDPNFYGAKISTARVFADVLLTQAPGIAQSVLTGGETIGAVPEVQF
ncbi:MAG: acyl-CoA dehydrogenase C-terminal domain-containing protein, partial [Janthinobacterium lividum]